ncbi:MAG: 5'/3'-nucleotidase SurE [Sphingomonadaceae bacterium]
MRILLTNDDGINAPGLKILESIARAISDDIWIVAPAEEQSGAGHSLTLTRPLRIRRIDDRRFAVTGTPTDAVLLALGKIMVDAKPDLILSGVNRGANLGDDVTYSGTVAAAMEGTLAGIPSIAMSQVYAQEGLGDDVSFATATMWGERVLRPLISFAMPENTLLNINFPSGSAKGVRVVAQGFHDYSRAQIVTGRDPRGYDYHWFALGGARQTPAHSTDLEAVNDGYIAVTPLTLDLTAHATLGALKTCFDDDAAMS